MKSKDYIKITKLKPSRNPIAPTPNKKDYVPGEDNGFVSLPVDYTAEGYLLEDVQIGKPVLIERHKRNGVESLGFMNTSRIKKITGNKLETENSIYLIEKLR